MKSVINKNFKEFITDRVNMAMLCLPMLIFIILDLSDGSFDVIGVFNRLVLSVVLYLLTFAPKTFALEKDNKTFETLLSLPIDFKKVFFATFISVGFFVIIPSTVYFILSSIIMLIVDFNNVYIVSIISTKFMLSIFMVINMTFISLIHSLKSPGLIACSLKLPFILAFFTIPYSILDALLMESNMASSMLIIGYLVVNIIIFIIAYLMVKPILKKPTLLKSYGQGAE